MTPVQPRAAFGLSGRRAWPRPSGRGRGFTLIEVVGALVVFSIGTLMVMQVGSSLTTQMRYAGARSEMVVLANERVDSIEALPFASVVAGVSQDTVVVSGWEYERIVTVTSITPVLAKVEVTLQRVDGGGPSHAVVSYTSDVW